MLFTFLRVLYDFWGVMLIDYVALTSSYNMLLKQPITAGSTQWQKKVDPEIQSNKKLCSVHAFLTPPGMWKMYLTNSLLKTNCNQVNAVFSVKAGYAFLQYLHPSQKTWQYVQFCINDSLKYEDSITAWHAWQYFIMYIKLPRFLLKQKFLS